MSRTSFGRTEAADRAEEGIPAAGTVSPALAGLIEDVIRRRTSGERVPDESVIVDHPELMPELAEQLDALRRIEKAEAEASRVGSLRARAAQHGETVSGVAAAEAGQDRAPPNRANRIPTGACEWLARDLPGYAIAGEVHRGGQGTVYAALQKSTGRDVAIKVLHEGPFGGPADIARFEREVQVLAQLKHRNIVTVHDSGVASGRHYLVTDFVDGRRLDAYLASEQPSVDEILCLFVRVCDAVHSAHLLHIVHRDLKPNNILIDAEAEPHILDFGLAKGGGNDADRTSVTVTGQFVGSIQWASPEQAAGTAHTIDSPSDVYSIGVMLYHALTDSYPYDVSGGLNEVLYRIIHTEPTRPSSIRPQIGDEVETILLKCLAKEPARRYQDAGELKSDLERYLNNEPIAAKRDSRLYILRKFARRNRLKVAAACAFVLFLAITAGVTLALYARERQAVREGRKALQEAYLRQATARRMSPTPGRRLEAVAALEKALSIKSTPELLDELISALACPEIREIQQVPLDPYSHWGKITCDQSLTRFSQIVKDHAEVLSIPEGHVLLRVPGESAWLSNDGRLVLVHSPTGERLGELLCGWELWDTDSKRMIARLPDTTWPYAVSFSPDSRDLIVGVLDGSIRMYGCDDGALQHTIAPVDKRPIARASLSPDGRLIATRSEYASEAILRRVADGEVLARLPHPAIAYMVCWSPNGQMLAVACHDRHIYLWSAMDYRRLRVLSPGGTSGAALDWSPDGQRILESDWDGVSRIWQADSGQLLLKMLGTCRRYGTDERLVYFDDRDGRHTLSILEWLPSYVYKVLPAPINEEAVKDFDVSHDGSLVAVARTNRLHLQDSLTGMVMAEFDMKAETVLFAPDDRAVYTIGGGGVQRWTVHDQRQRKLPGPASVLFENSGNVAALSGDGHILACQSNNHVVVLDTLSADVKLVLDHLSPRPALSPDGRVLAIAPYFTGASEVPIISIPDGATFARLPVPGPSIALFDPTGGVLAVASSGGVTLWDTTSWRPSPRQLQTRLPDAMALDFSSDGNRLAVCVNMNRIALIDMAARKVDQWLLPPDVEVIRQLEFAPDGKRLYFSTTSGQLAFWDLRAVDAERTRLQQRR